MYINGQVENSNTQSVYINGQVKDSNTQSVYINDQVSNTQAVYINGQVKNGKILDVKFHPSWSRRFREEVDYVQTLTDGRTDGRTTDTRLRSDELFKVTRAYN